MRVFPSSVSALVVLVVAVALAGCGGGGSKPAAAKPGATQTAAPQTAPAQATSTTTASSGDETSSTTKSPRQAARKRQAVLAKVAPPRKRIPTPVPKEGDKSIQTFGQAAPETAFVAVAKAVRAFELAQADHDANTACLFLGSGVQKQLAMFAKLAAKKNPNAKTPKGCGALLGQMWRQPDPALAKQLRSVQVTDARVKGNRGFAIYRMRGLGKQTVPVVYEQGGWRVASLGGIPLE